MVQLPPSPTEVSQGAAPAPDVVPGSSPVPVVPITGTHLLRAARAAGPLVLCAAVASAIVFPGLRTTLRPERLIPPVAPLTEHVIVLPPVGAQTAATLAPALTLIPAVSEPALDLMPEPTPAPAAAVEPEPTPEPVAPEPEAIAPAPPASPPAPPAWQPPNVARIAFEPHIEQWRPLVREMLAEAAAEGRLTGAARKLDDDLLLAMIQQESAGDPTAESWAGALGLMQLMPATFSGLIYGDWYYVTPRVVIMDPVQNVRAGVRYMAEALQIHGGDLYWSVASYNAGAGATRAWLSVGLTAVPPIGGYWETAEYAPRILSNYAAHRPGLAVHIPAPITEDQIPGVIALLTSAGLW